MKQFISRLKIFIINSLHMTKKKTREMHELKVENLELQQKFDILEA